MRSSLTGKRVLIVEDELLVAMELERVLNAAGCQVSASAASIEKALDVIANDPPDAALLDINLRGRQVTPVAMALVARSIPFVVVTGYRPFQIVDPVLATAPRVSKPVEQRTLIQVIRETVANAANRNDKPSSQPVGCRQSR